MKSSPGSSDAHRSNRSSRFSLGLPSGLVSRMSHAAEAPAVFEAALYEKTWLKSMSPVGRSDRGRCKSLAA